jgi:hypothetical protein
MASLTVQLLKGLNPGPQMGAATVADTTVLDPAVKVKIAVGGTATTVTLTPVGPFIAGAPARVLGTSVANVTFEVPTWDYKGHKGSPRFGRCDITLSQATGVTIAASHRQGT